MIKELVLLAALSCPKTEIINESKEKWNANDEKILSIAKKRCGELYPDAPCVKKFYKEPDNAYKVVCGK